MQRPLTEIVSELWRSGNGLLGFVSIGDKVTKTKDIIRLVQELSYEHEQALWLLGQVLGTMSLPQNLKWITTESAREFERFLAGWNDKYKALTGDI